jgi:hypothetical protein
MDWKQVRITEKQLLLKKVLQADAAFSRLRLELAVPGDKHPDLHRFLQLSLL